VGRGKPDDQADAAEPTRGSGFDGGPRQTAPLPRPHDDATAEEIFEFYAGNSLLMHRELERRQEEARARMVAELVADSAAAPLGVDPPPPGKTRRRSPDPLPREKVEELEEKLHERIAVLDAEKKMPSRLTQEAAARALGKPFNRSRVQQGEKLLRLGWPLLRSLPANSARSADSAVYWPSPQEAASILASERAG
jgi:hypothetical protein